MVISLVLVGCLAFFVTIIAMAPRLLLRPMIRSSLWSIRDEVFDARRRGDLPFDDPAPKALIDRMERFIGGMDELTLGRLLLALPSFHRVPPEEKAVIAQALSSSLEGLGGEQRDLYRSFEKRFTVQIALTPFLGSWMGIFVVLVAIVLAPIVLIVGLVVGFSRTAQLKLRRLIFQSQALTETAACEVSLSGTDHPRVLIRH